MAPSYPVVDPATEELIETDETFRRLREEHQECERRLTAIHHKTLPSEEDEIEAKRLKVHKLQLKDRMEAIRRERRSEAG